MDCSVFTSNVKNLQQNGRQSAILKAKMLNFELNLQNRVIYPHIKFKNNPLKNKGARVFTRQKFTTDDRTDGRPLNFRGYDISPISAQRANKKH